jgi:hypothetical protein
MLWIFPRQGDNPALERAQRVNYCGVKKTLSGPAYGGPVRKVGLVVGRLKEKMRGLEVVLENK